MRQPTRRKIALPASARGTMYLCSFSTSIPEVAGADGVVGLDLGARSREDDLPGLEDVCGLRRLQGEVRVLLDEEDAEALLLVELAHDAKDLRDEQGREAERRLVEEQEL